MSSPTPPATLAERLRRLRLDPAALPILVAAIVLVGAVAWLLSRPLPPTTRPDDRLAADVAALRAELQQQAVLERRLAALEARGETLAPRLAALEEAERRLTSLEARPAPDLAPLREQIAALAPLREQVAALSPLREQAAAADRRAAALDEKLTAVERIARDTAARPAIDPTTLASRQAVEAMTQRLDRLSDRAEASIRQEESRAAGNAARIETLARETTTRATALEQAQTQGQTQLAQRLAAAEQSLANRVAALEQALAARTATIEGQATRLAELEGAAQRLAALEGRAGRMATLDALRASLDAGRALGGPLATLREPPEALARFATAAPPTEAALRLSFEEAARAGRAASDPVREGQGVLDSAVSRLSGLVTVRRGDEMLMGDAAALEIDRARRALEAGDLEGALTRLARLSPPAREAMRGWISQAEALVAARAALRTLAAG